MSSGILQEFDEGISDSRIGIVTRLTDSCLTVAPREFVCDIPFVGFIDEKAEAASRTPPFSSSTYLLLIRNVADSRHIAQQALNAAFRAKLNIVMK